MLTKRLLKESLLRLMARKNIREISIRELCAEAGINRATFYAHYDTEYDLLREIERDFIDELNNFVKKFGSGASDLLCDRVEIACKYLREHSDAAKILFANNSPESNFAAMLFGQDMVHGVLPKRYVEKFGEDGINLIMYYLINGTYNMIRFWLLNDVNKTPKEMGQIMSELLNNFFTD